MAENAPPNRNDGSRDNKSKPQPPARPRGPSFWILALLLVAVAVLLFPGTWEKKSYVDIWFFEEQLENGNIREVVFVGQSKLQGTFRERPPAPDRYNKEGELEPLLDRNDKPILLQENFVVSLEGISDTRRSSIEDDCDAKGVRQSRESAKDPAAIFILIIYIALPIMLIFFLWTMYRRSRDPLGGGGFLSGFGRSPAKRFEGEPQSTTFDDVAGLDSTKEDLQEIIEFLQSPERFQKLGGRVPKGVLLFGPPGTGKTLLARAVAGEAEVPFFSVSGSEFIQMFVGVGASRVRDLFRQAKETSPAIIFIDEIDAVGRQRGAGLGGGHDEREQTLNQILSEMDGFTPNDSVIVLAASNRPDVLDPALMRPGRFDRHVTVGHPTKKGRLAIFKVHVRDVPLAEDVDLERMAAGTIGMTGADIRNLVNEAALWAARKESSKVTMEDFEFARDKVLLGPKREDLLNEKEKEKTAYHESGHALLAWLSTGANRVHKVTVIPRGQALGVTHILPEEDRMNIGEGEMHDRLDFLLGGRAAEQLVYHEYSAGAENDLERATSMARKMVTQWGMSEQLGPVSYKLSDDDPFLGREMHQQRAFSEHTMQVIDQEVARVLHDSADRAYQILAENRDKLDRLAQALIEEEELGEAEITDLIGPAVHLQKAEDARAGEELVAKKTIKEPE